MQIVLEAVVKTLASFVGTFGFAIFMHAPKRAWLPASAIGAVAYLLGRSRRASFVAGVLGVLLADIAVGVMNFTSGIDQTLRLGSAGALDVVVISGLLAVLLCELVGELLERIQNGAAHDAAISTGRRRNHE